uniref:ABCB1 n=1 Tax=Arundo donax TaxID=35708 RepID=A0A0A9EUY8_ARUDO
MRARTVLLPHPLGPTSASVLPARARRQRSWNTCMSGRDG